MSSPICFVIVVYHPFLDHLKQLLTHLRAWLVVVVDNTPGNGQEVRAASRTWGNNVTLITNHENLGYAGGNNRGIHYAVTREKDWVVVLNDDLNFNQKAIDMFCASLYHTPPGIVGPFGGSLDPNRWTTIFSSDADAQRRDNFIYLSGSFLAIHKQVIKEVGLFYEPYFIYYEDVELCLRAKKTGFLLTQRQIKIKHDETSSFGPGSWRHQYYLARNHLLFVERNAPMRIKAREFLRLPQTIWEHQKKGENGALVGVRDYFLRRFGAYKDSL